jgi:hypothetical protein
LKSQLKKWNERWVILDPTTGKIEYKYGILQSFVLLGNTF